MSHVRTRFAAVAVDPLPSTSAPLLPSRPAQAVPTKSLWAQNTFSGRLGRYVGVRTRAGELEVAVARTGASVSWVAADKALSRAEASQWFAKAGFST